MPGILKDKTKDGKWRAWYKSHLIAPDGRRKTVKFTGTRRYNETLTLAPRAAGKGRPHRCGHGSGSGGSAAVAGFCGHGSGLPGVRRSPGRSRRPPMGSHPRPQSARTARLVARADRLQDPPGPVGRPATGRNRAGQAARPRAHQQDATQLPGIATVFLPLVRGPRLPAQRPSGTPAQIRCVAAHTVGAP